MAYTHQNWFGLGELRVGVPYRSAGTPTTPKLNAFNRYINPFHDLEDALDALMEVENANGYEFRPTGYAYQHAKGYLKTEGLRPLLRVSRPELIPDGEGGIDIEWEHGNRKLALSCRGRANQRDFIYWRENGGQYDGDEASPELLREKLSWLLRVRHIIIYA